MRVLDVDLLQQGIRRNIEWMDRLGKQALDIQWSVEGLVEMDSSFTGEGGTAIREYYAECHLPFLQFFQVFTGSFQQILRQMDDALHSLEPAVSGHILEEFLAGELEQGLTLIGKLTEVLTDEANQIMDMVSDIVALPHLDDGAVQEGILQSKRKRDDTVDQLQAFDTTQTASLQVVEKDLQTMKDWLAGMEGLFQNGLNGISFQAGHWRGNPSRNQLVLNLATRESSFQSTTLTKELSNMLTIFLSGISPIPFGLGGLILPVKGFMGPGILAAANQKLETGTSKEELDEIYAALKEKYPDLAVNHSDVERTYSTDESITYAGKRKVLGGNGSGTPDGLAWVTIGTVNYFTEDIATIVSPDARLDERLLAAAFTFVKPLKYVDDGIEIGETAVKSLKAKGVGKAEPGFGDKEKSINLVKYGGQYTKVNGKKVLKSNIEYKTNEGYYYKTDSEGRISNVEATLQLGKADRNSYAQRTVGREDRLPNDDGGHLIATIFKGSGEIDNLVPMNATLNRKEYKALEASWRRALEAGKEVKIIVKPIYMEKSSRPTEFKISYTIDGKKYSERLTNYPGGK